MAFTDDQKLSIVKILGVTPSLLNAQIIALGASLTTAVETAVIAEITRWNAGAGTDFVRLEPTESNYGVRTNASDTKEDIRRNIALLLEMQDLISSYAGIGTIQCGV